MWTHRPISDLPSTSSIPSSSPPLPPLPPNPTRQSHYRTTNPSSASSLSTKNSRGSTSSKGLPGIILVRDSGGDGSISNKGSGKKPSTSVASGSASLNSEEKEMIHITNHGAEEGGNGGGDGGGGSGSGGGGGGGAFSILRKSKSATATNSSQSPKATSPSGSTSVSPSLVPHTNPFLANKRPSMDNLRIKSSSKGKGKEKDPGKDERRGSGVRTSNVGLGGSNSGLMKTEDREKVRKERRREPSTDSGGNRTGHETSSMERKQHRPPSHRHQESSKSSHHLTHYQADAWGIPIKPPNSTSPNSSKGGGKKRTSVSGYPGEGGGGESKSPQREMGGKKRLGSADDGVMTVNKEKAKEKGKSRSGSAGNSAAPTASGSGTSPPPLNSSGAAGSDSKWASLAPMVRIPGHHHRKPSSDQVPPASSLATGGSSAAVSKQLSSHQQVQSPVSYSQPGSASSTSPVSPPLGIATANTVKFVSKAHSSPSVPTQAPSSSTVGQQHPLPIPSAAVGTSPSGSGPGPTATPSSWQVEMQQRLHASSNTSLDKGLRHRRSSGHLNNGLSPPPPRRKQPTAGSFPDAQANSRTLSFFPNSVASSKLAGGNSSGGGVNLNNNPVVHSNHSSSSSLASPPSISSLNKSFGVGSKSASRTTSPTRSGPSSSQVQLHSGRTGSDSFIAKPSLEGLMEHAQESRSSTSSTQNPSSSSDVHTTATGTDDSSSNHDHMTGLGWTFRKALMEQQSRIGSGVKASSPEGPGLFAGRSASVEVLRNSQFIKSSQEEFDRDYEGPEDVQGEEAETISDGHQGRPFPFDQDTNSEWRGYYEKGDSIAVDPWRGTGTILDDSRPSLELNTSTTPMPGHFPPPTSVPTSPTEEGGFDENLSQSQRNPSPTVITEATSSDPETDPLPASSLPHHPDIPLPPNSVPTTVSGNKSLDLHFGVGLGYPGTRAMGRPGGVPSDLFTSQQPIWQPNAEISSSDALGLEIESGSERGTAPEEVDPGPPQQNYPVRPSFDQQPTKAGMTLTPTSQAQGLPSDRLSVGSGGRSAKSSMSPLVTANASLTDTSSGSNSMESTRLQRSDGSVTLAEDPDVVLRVDKGKGKASFEEEESEVIREIELCVEEGRSSTGDSSEFARSSGDSRTPLHQVQAKPSSSFESGTRNVLPPRRSADEARGISSSAFHHLSGSKDLVASTAFPPSPDPKERPGWRKRSSTLFSIPDSQQQQQQQLSAPRTPARKSESSSDLHALSNGMRPPPPQPQTQSPKSKTRTEKLASLLFPSTSLTLAPNPSPIIQPQPRTSLQGRRDTMDESLRRPSTSNGPHPSLPSSSAPPVSDQVLPTRPSVVISRPPTGSPNEKDPLSQSFPRSSGSSPKGQPTVLTQRRHFSESLAHNQQPGNTLNADSRSHDSPKMMMSRHLSASPPGSPIHAPTGPSATTTPLLSPETRSTTLPEDATPRLRKSSLTSSFGFLKRAKSTTIRPSSPEASRKQHQGHSDSEPLVQGSPIVTKQRLVQSEEQTRPGVQHVRSDHQLDVLTSPARPLTPPVESRPSSRLSSEQPRKSSERALGTKRSGLGLNLNFFGRKTSSDSKLDAKDSASNEEEYQGTADAPGRTSDASASESPQHEINEPYDAPAPTLPDIMTTGNFRLSFGRFGSDAKSSSFSISGRVTGEQRPTIPTTRQPMVDSLPPLDLRPQSLKRRFSLTASANHSNVDSPMLQAREAALLPRHSADSARKRSSTIVDYPPERRSYDLVPPRNKSSSSLSPSTPHSSSPVAAFGNFVGSLVHLGRGSSANGKDDRNNLFPARVPPSSRSSEEAPRPSTDSSDDKRRRPRSKSGAFPFGPFRSSTMFSNGNTGISPATSHGTLRDSDQHLSPQPGPSSRSSFSSSRSSLSQMATNMNQPESGFTKQRSESPARPRRQPSDNVLDSGNTSEPEQSGQVIVAVQSPTPVQPPKPLSAAKIAVASDDTPESYLEKLTRAVSKTEIAGLLAESGDPFHVSCLKAYFTSFDFTDLPLDIALRKLLLEITLPKETQQIDRVIETFASCYCSCNNGLFTSPDQAYLLAFSLIMLHTDAFNKNNKNKMTKADYCRNIGRGLDGFPKEVLEYFFDQTVNYEFIHLEDEFDGDRQLTGDSYANATHKDKAKWDPYYLIRVAPDLLLELKPDIDRYIPPRNPYSITGSVPFFNATELYQSFAHAREIQLLSRTTAGEVSPTSEFLPLPSPGEGSTTEVSHLKVAKAGVLSRKDDLIQGGKKSNARKWKAWSVILTATQLLFFKDAPWVAPLIEQENQRAILPSGVIAPQQSTMVLPTMATLKPDAVLSLAFCVAIYDWTYIKYPNTFRLVAQNGRQFLFQARNEREMNEWIAHINYASTFKSAGIRMRDKLPQLPSTTNSGLSKMSTPAGGSNFSKMSTTSSIGASSSKMSHASTLSAVTASEEAPSSSSNGQDSRASTMPPSELEDYVFQRSLSSNLRAPRTGSLRGLPRSEVLRNKIAEFEAEIEAAKGSLQTDIRVTRNLAILTPLQKTTRDRIQIAIGPLEKRIRHARLELAKLVCFREVLARELLAEEREVHRFKPGSIGRSGRRPGSPSMPDFQPRTGSMKQRSRVRPSTASSVSATSFAPHPLDSSFHSSMKEEETSFDADEDEGAMTDNEIDRRRWSHNFQPPSHLQLSHSDVESQGDQHEVLEFISPNFSAPDEFSPDPTPQLGSRFLPRHPSDEFGQHRPSALQGIREERRSEIES